MEFFAEGANRGSGLFENEDEDQFDDEKHQAKRDEESVVIAN